MHSRILTKKNDVGGNPPRVVVFGPLGAIPGSPRKGTEMTGYTVHSGTTKKFAMGWDRVFSKSAKKTDKPAPRTKKAEQKKSYGK